MSKKSASNSLCDLVRSEAHRLMTQMDPDPRHALQVCRLALDLFDQLIPLHGFGGDERFILECAALLHDIGWAVNPSAHHKGSHDAILAEPLGGLDENRRLLVALVARYHRKSHPQRKHEGYCNLPQNERRVVRILASILRIADGLDRSHTDNVTEIACDLYEEGVRLRLVTRTSARDELYGLQKKSGLFEEVFGLTVWPQLVPNLSDCK